MAWGGNHSRMTAKQRAHFLRTSNRSLPKQDNPHGVPTVVMKQLQRERLSSDPVAFNTKLQELLAQHKGG